MNFLTTPRFAELAEEQTGQPLFRRYLAKAGPLSLLCLPIAVLFACSGSQGVSRASLFTGDPAPPFEAALTSGDTVSLDGLRGNGVILNFWSTWCAPCVRELPLLDSVAREHSADGVRVIAVNMGESEKEILAFLEDFDLGFAVALDPQGTVSRLYAVPGLPMSFFIDRSGIIRYRRIGELKEDHIARGLERVR